MKRRKLTRKDFAGLRQHYPVLSQEEMRQYVGGLNAEGYWENNDSLFTAVNPYVIDFGVTPFSSSFYGYSDWDIDGGELPEVVIGGSYYGGYDNSSEWGNTGNDYGYPGWDGNSNTGYEGYWGYESNRPEDNKRGDIMNEPWACMFNCMNYINPSKSAEEYYYMYLAKYGESDPEHFGGLYYMERNAALEACGFKSNEVNYVSTNPNYKYVIVYVTDNNESHSVVATSPLKDKSIVVYDPTMKASYEIDIDDIATIYEVVK